MQKQLKHLKALKNLNETLNSEAEINAERQCLKVCVLGFLEFIWYFGKFL